MRKTKLFYLLPFTALALTSCSDDYFTPTRVTAEKVSVSQSAQEISYDINQVTDATIAQIAHSYKRHGGDGLDITVTYNPNASASSFSATEAMQRAGDIADKLRNDHYVQGLKVSILPANTKTHKLFVHYNEYQAHKPEGCDLAPGLEDSQTHTEDRLEDYELGCSVQTIMAKQVVRKKDLMGRTANEDYDGRRSVTALEGGEYYNGTMSMPLEGEQATNEN